MRSKQINRRILGLVLVIALWCATAMTFATEAFAQEVTTVFLVRHAEKTDTGGDDAVLTSAGKERAIALAHVLADAKLSAIFVSSIKRTRLTAEPTKEMTGLEPVTLDAGKTAEKILSDFKGKTVLVVGHSNTVGRIADDLGAHGIGELPPDAFDRFFVIHIAGKQATLERLRYGDP